MSRLSDCDAPMKESRQRDPHTKFPAVRLPGFRRGSLYPHLIQAKKKRWCGSETIRKQLAFERDALERRGFQVHESLTETSRSIICFRRISTDHQTGISRLTRHRHRTGGGRPAGPTRRSRARGPSRGDPDDPDPPATNGQRRGDRTDRVCVECGVDIGHLSARAVTCSDRCRKRRSRREKRPSTTEEPQQSHDLLIRIERLSRERSQIWLGRAEGSAWEITEALEGLWWELREARVRSRRSR
jgi:hypothetical protein